MGFIYGIAFGGFPPLVYYLRLQRKKGMLIGRYELYKVAFVVGIAISAFVTSNLVLAFWSTTRSRF
jgi:hypothetical protein